MSGQMPESSWDGWGDDETGQVAIEIDGATFHLSPGSARLLAGELSAWADFAEAESSS